MVVDNKLENQEIIKKIKKWLNLIKKENNPETAADMFRDIFEEEYEYSFIKDNNDDYYEYYEEIYRLKNGISLSVVTGAGQIYANEVTHRGTDVYLSFKLHEYDEYRVYIFSQNNKKRYMNVIENLFEKTESEVNNNE